MPLTIEMVPLSAVRVDPGNVRRHPARNLQAIKASLQRFGQRKPLVVDTKGIILAGNGTWEAARGLGWERIAIVRTDLTGSEARAYALADNRTAELAEWDDAGLAALLSSLDAEGIPSSMLGWDATDLTALLDGLEPAEGQTDPDEVPPTAPARVKAGELWALGDHRLLCGDANRAADVSRALGGVQPDILFTDPPYGISIVGTGGKVAGDARLRFGGKSGKVVKGRRYSRIVGDDKPFDPTPFLKLASLIILFGANNYADKLPPSSRWFVWDKVPGASETINNSHGDAELLWTNADGRAVKTYRHKWFGLIREGARDVEMGRRIHPTQKPVGLCIQIMRDHVGRVIFDPFSGSGSTLIAAEQTGRVARLMEIEPHYCDVILSRWEKFTGKKAVLLETPP